MPAPPERGFLSKALWSMVAGRLANMQSGTRTDLQPKTNWSEVSINTVESFIIPMNLHRRHLTVGQRSMVAGRLANMCSGSRADLEPNALMPEVLQDIEISQEHAAELLNRSPLKW